VIERIIAGFAIICFLVGTSFYSGCQYTEDKYKQAQIKQASLNAEKLQDAITKAETQTRLLYEDKIRHLNKPLPDKCMLSPEFRMQFDFTTGLPEVATTQTVTTQEVIDATRDNNFNCRQNIIWLNECNEICK
jgi:hypothetical protein